MEPILAILIGFMTSGALAIGGFFKWQGDAQITLIPEGLKKVSWQQNKGFYELRFQIPLVNKGKQNGMLMEIFAQPAYPGKVLEQIKIMSTFRMKKEDARKDWYWEAVIIKKRTSHMLEGSIIIYYPGDPQELVKELPSFTLVVHLKTVGRKRIDLKVTELNFDLKEIMESGDEPLEPK